ncbi:response regulator [Saprospiraceae bacterium]|nr:response regulator [Saprospiraceae bacterium]
MKLILIIEDNQDVRENIAEILGLSGYRTAEAENGKIGIRMIQETKPDLIICDVMMPELDGFGVLKILNRQPEFMDIPFMFLTAKSEKNDFRKGMGLGADDYITKPFDDVELLESIEIRLKKSERLQAVDNSSDGIQQFFSEAKATKEFEKLSEGRESRKYNKKYLVYEVNQYPRWLYFVKSGQVKCYRTNEFGKDLITDIYSEGDFFGFIPLLKNNKYTENAMALEDAILYMIPPEDFKILLFNNRDFAAKFIKMLANHASHSTAQLIDLAYSSVRKKIANALLLLSDKLEKDSIYVLRDDLAALAGTTKETTVRTLTDFKKEGIIKALDQNIVILDREALIEMPQ